MRQFRQIFSVLTAGTILVAGCSVKNNMLNNNYTVSPNPLEVKGDTITINMSANIPAKSINPKANIQFQPFLKTAKGDVQLKAITVGGESVTDNVDFKISSKTGGKITYTERIPYNPDLRRATLYPDFSVKVGETYTRIEGSSDKVLAEGTIATSQLVKNTAGNMVFDNTEYTSSTSTQTVQIYFPQDVAKFNAAFKMGKLFNNKDQIAKLKQVLKSNKDWQVKGISINAFASPDGELSRNDGLAKNRSQSTFDYFKKELKKLGFTEVNDQNFKMGYSLAEDWAGYEKAVAESNAPEKEAALAVIRNKGISDADKETQLRDNNPKFWAATKNTIFPVLRRSEVVVSGQTPIKSDDELKASITKLETLTDVELLQLGRLSADEAGKTNVYNAFIAKYPEDWRGYNNLGAVQVTAGKTSEGLANLEKANSLSPENPAVLANIANANLATGAYAKAEEGFTKASSKGANVSYGIGVLNIKKGNYGEAVNQLTKSGIKDFNYALAQLLNGNAEGAKTTIDNMKPEELTWDCYYLRAIVGARTSNQDVLTTNLTKAVQMNGEVRNLAKDDVEFIKYWSNPTFQGAIR